MAKVVFGRYSPYHTFTHKLDPRNKVFITLLLMVAIFFQFGNWSTTLIFSGLYLLLLIIWMIISKVSFLELFKSLGSMWFFVILIFAIYIFMPATPAIKENGHVAFTINNYPIYRESFFQAGYIITRIILMISLMMILTSTTKPMDLTYAFEWYMTPLKIFHFPASILAMILSIALRFIPTLLDESERIMKAQASRGVDFDHGGLFKKFKSMISIIIPLFMSAIDRSEQLADAMEARGYDPKGKRTRYRKLHFRLKDLFVLLFVLVLVSGVITLYVFDKNGYPINIIKFLFGVEPIF